MLPVQVIFDNHGSHKLKINPDQTFLEDEKGNLWPILSRKIADERATKFAVENKIIKEGARHAFWGAAANLLKTGQSNQKPLRMVFSFTLVKLLQLRCCGFS